MRKISPAPLLVAVSLLFALLGCGGSGSAASSGSSTVSSASSASGSLSPSARKIRIVALGDSDTTGAGDPTGQGWVGRYAALIQQGTGLQVTVDNRAQDGKTSDVLRSEVTSDTVTRQALQGASVVLLGIGGADLNRGDDALTAGRCKGRACYQPVLREFSRNFPATVAAIRGLSGSALIRAISLPNYYPGAGDAIPPEITGDISLYEVVTERDVVCGAVRTYGGDCIDVVRAFNGPPGTGDAYTAGLMTKDPCCYPSDKGQQLMAELLYRLGVAALRT